MFPYITIFDFNISMYYLMIFVGFLSMTIFNISTRKKNNYNIFQAIVLSIIVNIFAILGAIVLYKIENITSENFYNIGLSFYGTVLFLPLFMFLLSKILKKFIYIDSSIWGISVPLELAFVRFGCFLGGCCEGIISDYGIQFYTDPIGIKRIPIQIIEVFFDILIFIILLYIQKRFKIKKIIYPVFMILYSVVRFVLEIFRNTDKHLLYLSNGQIFSVITFIIAFSYICVVWSRKNEL